MICINARVVHLLSNPDPVPDPLESGQNLGKSIPSYRIFGARETLTATDMCSTSLYPIPRFCVCTTPRTDQWNAAPCCPRLQ